MTSFLLIISFLLHLITLAAVYQLLKKVKGTEEEPNAMDVAAVIEQSLEELKEENNRLERLLAERDKKAETKLEKIDEPRAEINHREREEKQTEEVDFSSMEDDISHLVGTTPGYEMEQSLESRILQLHEEGNSIESIAKTLNCGKTEAELVIKMYSK